MSKKRHNYSQKMDQSPAVTSLLDNMIDGVEFESLIKVKAVNLNLVEEIRRSINEIETIRERPLFCYLGNIINTSIKSSISIDYNDDLPFSEMISTVDKKVKDIDIILVTPGGSAQQVAKFVDKLRPRFDNVTFILPNMAMSAGTIFCMSGDEIIMGPNAYIGPIDPQVPNKDGTFMPAQAILTLIEDIQKRGEENIKKGQNPQWSDLQLLRQMDPKEIGNAISASQYSIELVKDFLYNYKFKTWINHSSDGKSVTDNEKMVKSEEIATHLCSHKEWKSHSRGITRKAAWEECKIKIMHTEDVLNLDRVIRRFWALFYWTFENTPMAKVFISKNYCIIRNDPSLMNRR